MSRNRIIYQTLGVYASQVGATGAQTGDNSIGQLTRVQSFDSDFSRKLQDINQFGNLAAIDRLDTEAPTVKANLSYYVTDGGNENLLGLTVSTGGEGTSCLSGILKKVTDEKNIYLLVVAEGSDASNYAGGISGVVGIGNTFVTSYSLEAAVGAIPKATVAIEALNYRTYADADGTNNVPAVNPANGLPVQGVEFCLPQHKTNAYGTQPTALLPGDVVLTIDGIIGADIPDLKVQTATLSFDLNRQPLNRLGSKFAFSREIKFPATAKLTVAAELGDLTDGNLSDLLCETGFHDMTLLIKRINCSGKGALAISASLKGAKLISQSIKTSIDGNASLNADFEVSIGGAEQMDKGLFLSGSYL